MPPKLPLPRGWKHRVRSSVLHILALSHYTFTVLLARAANSKNRQVKLRAQIDRRDNEIVLLQEELRIKDARMERVYWSSDIGHRSAPPQSLLPQ